MPFIGLAFFIQLGFAIHVIKTGREIYWIYIIMFLPGIGAGLYFFTQVLPEIGQSRTVHSAKNSLIKAIDPKRELRQRKAQLKLANTLENKLKLAEECLQAGLYEDAIELFQESLTGIGEGDPDTLLKLAQAYFANQDFQKSLQTLDQLIEINPQYNSTDGHLLYARSLQELGRKEKALEEYKVVAETFPGEEARVRYALLLQDQEQFAQAKALLKQVIERSKLAPKFYQKKEKHWINKAKKLLQQMEI